MIWLPKNVDEEITQALYGYEAKISWEVQMCLCSHSLTPLHALVRGALILYALQSLPPSLCSHLSSEQHLPSRSRGQNLRTISASFLASKHSGIHPGLIFKVYSEPNHSLYFHLRHLLA